MSDASCRLLTVAFDMLEELKTPPEILLEGTGLTLAQVRNERTWIRWSEMCLIMGRLSRLVGGNEQLRENTVRLMMDSSGNRSMRLVVQALASPKALYRSTARWVSAQLFSMVTWRYEDMDGNALRMHLSYGKDYEVMEQLPFMVAATMEVLPTLLGLPSAEVQYVASGRTITYEVRVPPSRTLWTRLRRLFQAIFAPDSVVGELERQAEVLRERNRELELARQREERVSQARYSFLSTISHELRTPLNGILGSAQVLEDASLSPEHRELVRANLASAAHLNQLIESILNFNRIYTGDIELERAPFSLRELLEERLAAFRPLLEQSRNHARLVSPPGESLVTGDRVWLARALDALLDNAVRFTRDGQITLSAEHCKEGDCWKLAVCDTGEGIPPERLAEALSPMWQSDSSMPRRHGGLGLGLALVRHAAEAMGGRVLCSSTLGQGTQIQIQVPLPAADPILLPPPTPLPTSAPLDTLAPPCILVVEDNAINRLVAQRMLTSLGYTTRLACDGEEGVRCFREGGIAAILMDCQMPVMDGYTATRTIRADEALAPDAGHIPIVALTAHASDADRRIALGSGMDRYLTKPVQRADLEQTLGDLLRVAQQQIA